MSAALDYEHAAQFMDAIPKGRWSSYKDVAGVAGNAGAAQRIGTWIRGDSSELVNVHRVLRSNGKVSDLYASTKAGAPKDAAEVRERLASEGVPFKGLRAHPDHKFEAADWDP